MRKLLTCATLAMLALTGCGDDDDPTGPGNGNPNLQGSMSARIDGTQWQATSSIAATYNNGILSFAGTDLNATLGMAAVVSGPTTIQIGPTNPANAILTYANGQGWVASVVGGSGTITITTFTANSATGTFSFTMVPSGGGAGTRSVTNGTFDVRF